MRDVPHVVDEVVFADGVKAYANAVHIAITDRNRLVGHPTQSSNRDYIENELKRATELRSLVPVLLMQPYERIEVRPAIDVPGLKVPARTAYHLPVYTLIGEFQSIQTLSEDNDVSLLTVMWFQDSIETLVDERAIDEFAGQVWFEKAAEFSLA